VGAEGDQDGPLGALDGELDVGALEIGALDTGALGAGVLGIGVLGAGVPDPGARGPDDPVLLPSVGSWAAEGVVTSPSWP
jgi:hypothetical protein